MTPEQKSHLSNLLLLAQDGALDSYREFLAEVAVVLRAYVARRIFIPSRVEELVQDIIIALHKARPTYRPEADFSRWLYAIADFRIAQFRLVRGQP